MKELGLKFNTGSSLLFFPYDKNSDNPRITIVRQGPGTLTLRGRDWGKLPYNTVFFGELFFGEAYVYGRFTTATVPGGPTYPVCMELWQTEGVKGVEKEPANEPDSATVRTAVHLKPVERFE